MTIDLWTPLKHSWPASRVVLVRRAAEALTGRPEAAPPAPEPAGPLPVAEQVLR